MGSIAVENDVETSKAVLFFDIDNCLYPRSSKVQDVLSALIDTYIEKQLGLTKDEAIRLHHEYFKTYGMTIEGLVRHHNIDPLEYNVVVDDALPLDDLIKPNPQLRQLLEDVDRSKVRLWLLTNAYATHAKRVIKLLGIDDLFDGLTYCDYSNVPFISKPHPDAYAKAMKDAGVEEATDCYFVDDSYANCKSAQEFGWTAAHLVEQGLPLPPSHASQYQIRHLEELRNIFPQLFKSAA